MKRLVAGLLTIVVIIAGSSTASAGVEDETIVVTGPLSGTSYQIRHSCASSTLQVIRRTDSGVLVYNKTQLRGAQGVGSDAKSGFNGFDLDSPTISVDSFTSASTWSITESVDDANYVDIGRGTFDCPDYGAPTPSVFVPIKPQRVLDTRPDKRINSNGVRPGDKSSTVIGRSVLPDLPAGAVAVSATLTVTEASAGGFAQLLPTDAEPGRSSNVNPQYAGHTLANNAVSPLTNAGVAVYTRRAAHLIVDVNGYFVEAPTTARAGRYQSLTAPKRVLDTRPATAINHSTGIVGGRNTVTVPVSRWAGLDGKPVGAVAINVTATDTGGAGFLQSAATGTLVPGDSSIVNPTRAGDTVAAMTIVPVSAAGTIDIYTSTDSHVVVDVLGWFTNAAAPPSATGRFVPLEPERVLDTRLNGDAVNCCFDNVFQDTDIRTGRRNPGTRITTRVQTIHLDGARSLMINLTAVDATGAGYFQTGAAGGFVNGASSTVNTNRTGDTVANATIVSLGGIGQAPDDAFQVYTRSGGHVVADVAGYFTN